MTLVIIRKTPNSVSFSSDSRITFAPNMFIDCGIKIFPVPLKIYSPTASETGITRQIHAGILGMAVVGSPINTYTIKDSICEILQHLQAIIGYTDLSLSNIAKLVLKVFKKTTLDLYTVLGNSALSLIVLGGWCPLEHKIKLFKFWSELISGDVVSNCQEILTEDGTECFGSGKENALSAFRTNPSQMPLTVIRNIIVSQDIPTVGGALQYGDFRGGNFEVAGIVDYEVDQDGYFSKYHYTLRGIDLYKDDLERDAAGFHIEYTFMNPFQGEVDDLMKKFIDEN